ncbi:hypothetical protein GJA_738 [Janthinobacterium agaricidamnosum NBRC 102515 = DSM 9628]|uniref:Uncharacterized protein n=1 Tax=Janthinobacterium agaricidamnosum NBRC 102515 = DSM 9628 TaxID=1349767 RepID=W0V291_9BURK|nr:hypothetical protein GJA_738 [Janthinobacterium agaricidamnosum NBRC 102515 = DSM 9628]
MAPLAWLRLELQQPLLAPQPALPPQVWPLAWLPLLPLAWLQAWLPLSLLAWPLPWLQV